MIIYNFYFFRRSIYPFKYNSQQFREEHQLLEDDISAFVKDFRANRKEVFEVTEHVIESEEFIRQVSFN